jgi:hypothetical protein
VKAFSGDAFFVFRAAKKAHTAGGARLNQTASEKLITSLQQLRSEQRDGRSKKLYLFGVRDSQKAGRS